MIAGSYTLIGTGCISKVELLFMVLSHLQLQIAIVKKKRPSLKIIQCSNGIICIINIHEANCSIVLPYLTTWRYVIREKSYEY